MSELVVDTLPKTSAGQFSPKDPNQKTLERYNKYAYDYIQHTVPVMEKSPATMREWIDTALSFIEPGETVFEIGSAILRDAQYMRSRGYRVICSDATESFVKILKTNGEPAILFNVLEDQLTGTYPMFFANGVFPHFTENETLIALRNIHHSLAPNGVLAFSIKQGHGEGWITEKLEESVFAHYWSLEDITEILMQEGFEVKYSSSNQGLYPSHRWLNIIARKP